MKNHFLITLITLICGFSALTAQAQVKVSGTVTDKDGLAVIGAGVIEQGTLNGTTTGADGKYTITVASEKSVLEFSCIGYETTQQQVAGRSVIDIVMAEDAKLLDEVVVIGYGTVKKKDLTGAVAAVDGGKLSNLQATGLSQALQGSMPGVQVTRTSGLPGASATIRVRGITTIGDSDPLVIVDGVPVSTINDVDVDAIENVTVLKDAASASIYGARASAGVILITTNRAKEGSLSIDYNGSFSMLTRTRHPEQVSPQRFMELQNEANWNDAGNPEGRDYFTYEKEFIDHYMENHELDPDAYPLSDWDALMIKKWAPQHKHRVGISYGNKNIKSRAMLSYENEDALYVGRNVEQYTARLNNDIKINNFISASFDMTFNHKLSNNNQVNPVQAAFKYNPIYAAVWSDGTMGPGNNGTNTYARIHAGGFDNTERNAFYGKASLTITPFKNFTITGVFAPQLFSSKEKDYVKQAFYYREPGVLSENPLSGCTYNSLTETRADTKAITKQLLLNYKADFGKDHHTTYMLGYEDYSYFHESMNGASDQMELGGYPYLNLANKNFLTVGGNATDNAYLQPVAFHHHIRFDGYVQAILETDVGANKREISPFHHLSDAPRTVVPFMVTQSGKIEAQLVHQLNHGVIDGIILVVYRVAGAVVARRKEQHVGINGPQTVHHRGKFRKHVDVGVHVVDRKDNQLSFIRSNLIFRLLCLNFRLITKDKKQDHRHQGKHQ